MFVHALETLPNLLHFSIILSHTGHDDIPFSMTASSISFLKANENAEDSKGVDAKTNLANVRIVLRTASSLVRLLL